MIDLHPRSAELIASSVDRQLGPDEHDEMSRHLRECGSCRRLEQLLREDAAALAVPLLITPPRTIQAEVERQVAIPAVDPGLVRAIRVATLVAVLLFAVVVAAIGLALLQPRSTTPMETRAPEPAGLQHSHVNW
jgi:anti-sigma factor RsiW